MEASIYYLLSAFLLLHACGRPIYPSRSTEDTVPRPMKQRELYIQENAEHQDSSGFILTEHCDSLLFSSLNAVGRGERINILAARSETGQWFRRPLILPECHAAGESRSTISRDMLIGLLIYLWNFREADIIRELWDSAKSRSWVMGEGEGLEQFATVLSPSLIGLLAEMHYQLNGVDTPERSLPDITIFIADGGYANHLNLLVIYLSGQVRGGLTALQLSELTRYTTSIDPENLLGQALLSKYTEREFDMNRLSRYPTDRLPTTADWCESWYYQRHTGDPGHAPCGAGVPLEEHTGGDYLFLFRVLGM